MSIKRHEPASGAAAPKSEPCVVVSGHPVPVVRFELAERTISYLTAEVKRWELLSGEQDKLLIKAGSDVVIVIGRDLAAAHDALDNVRLQVLREAPGRRAALADGPWIQAIKIEPAKGEASKIEPR